LTLDKDSTLPAAEGAAKPGVAAHALPGRPCRVNLELVILALMAATILAVAFQDVLLRRTFVIDTRNAPTMFSYAYGDKELKGNSTGVVEPDQPLAWRCTLGTGYDYPFCGYEILFDPKGYAKGVDFSFAEKIVLDLDFRGAGDRMRVHLKNHDPRYSVVGRGETNKFNRLEFPVRQGAQRIEYAFEQFNVADWWLSENRIPPELSRPQFGNIVAVDLQTGFGAPPGAYRFQVRRIALEGKILSPARFYLSLLVGWMILITAVALLRNRSLKADLAERRRLEAKALRKAAEAEAAVAEREAAQCIAEEARQRAERSAARIQQVLENTSDCVYSLDRSWCFTFLNEKARQYLGEKACVGASIQEIFPDGQLAIFDHCFLEAIHHRHPASAEVYLAARNAWFEMCVVPDDDGITVFFRDVTARKGAEERARWLARHDSLTGLPNRLLFLEELDALVAEAAEFVVLMIDLDEFKQVNDTLGHDAGDALLCAFTQRLLASVRQGDLVARLGGDEFAIILNGIATEAEVEQAGASIFDALRAPHGHAGTLLDLKASIGASLFPVHGADRSELLKHADIAVYAAKADGRANLKIFRPEMRAAMQSRLSMVSLARDALGDDRLEPWYQPKIDLRTGRVTGFEALLRWRDPRGGIQGPDTIAAAFDDPTVAAEISERIIDRVIVDIGRFQAAGLPFGHVAINASAAEFRCGGFAQRLLNRLGIAGIAPHLVQIEVTETVFLGRGANCAEQTLATLSEAGVRIALDDFGTGYASLSHLKQFPVDILKIDKSFVRDLAASEDAAAIVSAVLNLGQSLGMEVVAEGIETIDQGAQLMAMGCRYGQGFLYSRAVPPVDLPALLRVHCGVAVRAA
jgi:diguanylate cyclase (GGDEF)-like protein